MEIGEIETALLEVDRVKEVAVVAQEDISGSQRLVAYYVPGFLPAPTAIQLRRDLSEKLPDYMVPNLFLRLDALPLTPNGKVDVRALPAPGQGRSELETPFVSPRTPVEHSLAEIWSEVLDLDQVGIHDNFLELGGDSLLASQVISLVIKTFQVEVSLRSLFETPTVADMAVVIVRNQSKELDQEELELLLVELEGLTEEQARLSAEEE